MPSICSQKRCAFIFMEALVQCIIAQQHRIIYNASRSRVVTHATNDAIILCNYVVPLTIPSYIDEMIMHRIYLLAVHNNYYSFVWCVVFN